ncbi:unnamed protein product [Rotaria sp. Silwood2]|nr:unnamed protein product [Rotaria sp. Silwood2]CAF3094153.1 unnamed protein product [Rotaria sp. Silwood2]CAF4381581.1 unnamed protein product [Rotaria sp. Silwood2]CAF4428324.1 unnamed protein product [Rotaria sp. Silwood2]
MWKIVQPHVSAWRLITYKLSNEFDHNIQIQGKTNIFCSSTLQKQMEENTDTSDYTQLTTEPIINSELIILTTCENVNYTSVNIFLIDQSGQIINSYSQTQSDESDTVTKIRVPQQAFRIEAILTLSNGNKIQRMEKHLISPMKYSIELTNQPYTLSIGQTIEMNYTIKSFTTGIVNLRLQIIDTLKLISNDVLEKNLTFFNETSEMTTFTLSKNYRQKIMDDMIIFALSTYNNQTNKYFWSLIANLKKIGILRGSSLANI